MNVLLMSFSYRTINVQRRRNCFLPWRERIEDFVKKR